MTHLQNNGVLRCNEENSKNDAFIDYINTEMDGLDLKIFRKR